MMGYWPEQAQPRICQTLIINKETREIFYNNSESDLNW